MLPGGTGVDGPDAWKSSITAKDALGYNPRTDRPAHASSCIATRIVGVV